jgi:hypothetical protein
VLQVVAGVHRGVCALRRCEGLGLAGSSPLLLAWLKFEVVGVFV